MKSRRCSVIFCVVKDASDAAKSYGVRLNPKKGEKITFSGGHKIVVLADS